MSDFECLVEIYEITEWRDNSVYQTKFLERNWVDMDDYHNPPKNFKYCPLSTEVALEFTNRNETTIRKKKK